MDLLPVAIFWALALLGLFGNRIFLIYLFFGCMPFAAFAVVPPQLTAGLTFTPTPIVALLIIGRYIVLSSKGLRFALSSLVSPRGLGLLGAFWLVAIVITMLMPHMFAGKILIAPMKMQLFEHTEYLRPTTQNISQLAYLSISILGVVAFSRLMIDEKQRQHALRALCIGAGIAIATGLIDLTTHYIPSIKFLLEPFRTATYALMTEAKIEGGIRRVVGLTPEASTYGGLCVSLLTLLYFTRQAIADNFLRLKAVPVLCCLLVVMAYLSTSSAALAGLAVVGAFAGAEWILRAAKTRRGTRAGRELELEFWAAFLVVGFVLLVVVLKPSLFDPVISLVDNMIFKKRSTSSFEERSLWTRVSWQAAVNTFGLGVGMGGTRASSQFVAVVSNTGFLGALLFYGFVLQTALRRAYPGDDMAKTLLSGVRWAILPIMTGSLLAGTSADFGLANAWLYGTAFAMVVASWRKARVEAAERRAVAAPSSPEPSPPDLRRKRTSGVAGT
jgi:hypothetical protein